MLTSIMNLLMLLAGEKSRGGFQRCSVTRQAGSGLASTSESQHLPQLRACLMHCQSSGAYGAPAFEGRYLYPNAEWTRPPEEALVTFLPAFAISTVSFAVKKPCSSTFANESAVSSSA